ncbi:patatin-like phospholipase family protein [Paenibacillus sp. y28]|uniref:patatin-like phospholipase family protein n=1 Tax=Paenibacillus sp. y28 TaxID=3129110 RepID=UPI0030165193
MACQFRNLIFEGGGVKGIAYVGALQELQRQHVLDGITRVGGTSAGAITAVLVALNYTLAEIEACMTSLDFSRLLDASSGYLRNTARLLRRFGWYKGDYFRSWIGGQIACKTGDPNMTFSELYALNTAVPFRELYLIGTNLSTGYSEVFSVETTPDMPIADAVRISMSIPFLFAAPSGSNGDIYVDGGLLNNYPIKLFDQKKYVQHAAHYCHKAYYDHHNAGIPADTNNGDMYIYNKETLGFRLDSAQEIAVFRDHALPKAHPIRSLFSFSKALMKTLLDSQEHSHLHSDDWDRTIYINTLGVKTTEFQLSEHKKKQLVQSGKNHTERYFCWFHHAGSRPANHTRQPPANNKQEDTNKDSP